MDDRSHSVENVLWNIQNISKELRVEAVFRKKEGRSGAVREESAVETDQSGVGESLSEVMDNVRPDVAHVACYQDFCVGHGKIGKEIYEE